MAKNRNKRIGKSLNKKQQPQKLSVVNKPSIEVLDAQVTRKLPHSGTSKGNSWFSKKMYIGYGILWLYFIVKLFVIDVEQWVLEVLGMGHYGLFLVLRIFIVPCLIAVFVTWKGYKFVLRHLFHFLTVPFYFTIFLILKLTYDNLVSRVDQRKNPTFLVFLLEFLGRFLVKVNYYLFSLLGISILLVCAFFPHDKPIQYFAIAVSLTLVVISIYQSVLKVVQPLKIFGFFKIDDIIAFSGKKRPLIPKHLDEKPKTRAQNIREMIFSHVLISVLQKNVSAVKEKQSFLIVGIADFFLLLFVITGYFTFLNYSLFLIAPANFEVQGSADFLGFAFYSFYSIPGEGVSIEPVSHLSKALKVISTCYGYYLFIFLTTILLGVFSEKFTKALESASEYLHLQSKMTEPKLSSLLGIPIIELKSLSITKLIKLLDLIKDEKPGHT